ncbi:hypothetical protein TUM19329_05360 [Legionella antarctica]|uniref:Secreted protein n=1 Tax=Legionella antarctica TaxID=2708020 RepID=A0A6F8T0J8_9GAMM|nr:hypothetical protein [Legionella antarctica]BCA94175.1 hypothetical protein TUM19329_05360 [Legionella antarctica]
MNTSKLSYPKYRLFFLALIFSSSSVCFAERAGGYHQDAGNHLSSGYNHNGGYRPNYGYHQSTDELNYYTAPNIGNYVPGSGWGSPTVVVEPANDNDNCQIQQCNPNGNCITTQTCD